MAGLGVNSGFADAAILANNIIKNAKTGNDIG
jgi:2-polyprenyl-6-methoxyphenol hydroxylase-like FAD-dependent oxidoreductase